METHDKKKIKYRCSLKSRTYQVPDMCACCYNPSDKKLNLKKERHIYGAVETISAEMPICSECDHHIRVRRLMLSFVVSLAILTWGLFLFTPARFMPPGFLNLIVSMIIPSVIVFLYLKVDSNWMIKHPGHCTTFKNPVSLSIDDSLLVFVFKNEQFARSFAELNHCEIETEV